MKITFGILAHVDAGKTTFSEQLLYRSHVIRTLGRVDKGSAYMDHSDIEKARGITVFSDIAHYRINGDTYYFIDTPGHTDFSADMERAISVMDYAILLINGSDGVQGHTETIWNLLNQYHIPVFLFINKLDLYSASYDVILKECQTRLSSHILDFNLMTPETMSDSETLIEVISEDDISILNNYLKGTAQWDKIQTATVKSIQDRSLFPCFGGSALSGEGIETFLNMFYRLTATNYNHHKSFAANILKIRYDDKKERLTYLKILNGALHVKDAITTQDNITEKIHQLRFYQGEHYTTAPEAEAGDIVAVTGLRHTVSGQEIDGQSRIQRIPALRPALQTKVCYDPSIPDRTMLESFQILEEEDPLLHISWETSLRQLSIQIMGKIQLEILKDLVKDRFGYEIYFDQPDVVYQETILAPVMGYGHFEPLRHYAEVALKLEPAQRGSGISFRSECHVDHLAINYQNLIRTHIFETVHKGVLTGAALTDVTFVLMDGISHIKHTEGGDFREAVYRAIRQGLMKAQCALLEPLYQFSISVPTTYVGRVMNDITKYYGHFEVSEVRDQQRTVITGSGPVSSFMNYSEELAILTGGQGYLSLQMNHYELCHNQAEAIESHPYNPDADIANPSCSVFCQKGTSIVVNWDEAESYMHTIK